MQYLYIKVGIVVSFLLAAGAYINAVKTIMGG
jgi:hypothetical protein